jgi:hypothetical protein
MFQSSERAFMETPSAITIANITSDNTSFIHDFLEIDSHADTCCIGATCCIISYTDKMCHVDPYYPKYRAIQNISIIQAATACDHPDTRRHIS